MKIVGLACLTLAIQLTTNTAHASSVMNGEFRTLSECLRVIENKSGQKLKIVTDKPNEVSGFLSNGKGFGCNMKSTGTKGTYFEGWYQVD